MPKNASSDGPKNNGNGVGAAVSAVASGSGFKGQELAAEIHATKEAHEWPERGNGGKSGDDIIEGDDLDNTLIGGAGDDTINGFGGNDRLIGGGGNDVLDGGVGDDVLIGGGGADHLTGGEGNDKFVLGEVEEDKVVDEPEEGEDVDDEGEEGEGEPSEEPTEEESDDGVDEEPIATLDHLADIEASAEGAFTDLIDITELVQGDLVTADNFAEFVRIEVDGLFVDADGSALTIDTDGDGVLDASAQGAYVATGAFVDGSQYAVQLGEELVVLVTAELTAGA